MLNQGEVVQIEAEFDGVVADPVWLWVQHPGATVSQPPIEMQKLSDTRYRAEYFCSDAGVYIYRIETSEPQVVDENIFSAKPKKLKKLAVSGNTFSVISETEVLAVMQFSENLIASETASSITLNLPDGTLASETTNTITVNL
jgi:hypothetical protein